MSLESSELSAIDRISHLNLAHRVQRDEGVNDFRKKQQDKQQDKKKAVHGDSELETPHDVVEVSSDYHAPDLPVPTALSAADIISGKTAIVRKQSASAARLSSQSSPDRHIDIEV